MNRTTSLNRLRNEQFDLVIIGAGASGAGCALDAVLRGYKVALIEKTDFAAETSSKSTKLIHGGVRYLEQAFKKLDFGQLKQVRHGLEERHTVLRNAPHLARPLPLVTPVGSWIEGLYFSIGLKLYDSFATNDTLPKSRWINKAEVLGKIPTLNKTRLHSAVVYYDGQLDDARYCLALVQSASENGAAVANHLEVNGFGKNAHGKLTEVNVSDRISGDHFTIRTKQVINCTGPFADHIRLMANDALPERIRPSKGVHIVLPYNILNGDHAMLIPKTSDGRVVFAIPFEGELMVGTTDTDSEGLDREAVLNDQEKQYLAETLNPYLAKPVDISKLKAGFGGLRPLLAADPSKSTKSLLRDHEVEVDETSGLVSLLGGKWTTYRLMAKDTIDQIDTLNGKNGACKTAEYVLAGGEGYEPEAWKSLMHKYGLTEAISRHLSKKYGSRAASVCALIEEDRSLAGQINAAYPYLLAEAAFCVRNEMAMTLRDFFARRIRFEITDWQATLDSLSVVANVLAKELDWDDVRKQNEISDYATHLKAFMEEAGIEIQEINEAK